MFSGILQVLRNPNTPRSKVAEEQSQTRGYQSGGVEDQPQCRGLWHSSSPSARSFSRSPFPPPPSFTQSPYPPRSLVRDGQTSPHRPRLVVSRSTCPLLSPPQRQQLCNRSCSNKTHTGPGSLTRRRSAVNHRGSKSSAKFWRHRHTVAE